jgi:hypothetical protein
LVPLVAALRASPCGRTLADEADPAQETEDSVKIDKQQLLTVLRTEGDNETAEKVESQLPDEIDTDNDGGALESVGLDRDELMAKLAAAGFGGSVAP